MKNTTISIVALSAIALFAILTVSSAQMLGGLHDEKPADEEVRKIVTSVQGQLEKEAKEKYKSLEPISYRKQIVAGANYFVKVLGTTEDGKKSHIHMRIYKPFKGPLELSAIRKDQDKSKPLEYFDKK